MKDLSSIIDLVKIIRRKITDETDVVWTRYPSVNELQTDIDQNLRALELGDLQALESIQQLFLPTATFQELSLSNGWADEFLLLAARFDQAYEKVKTTTP